MMVKQEMISGPFQATLCTVITLNPESTVRAERSIIPYSTEKHRRNQATHTSLDVMLDKISTIIGTLMEIENCQILGQVSRDSPCWMKNHRMDFQGPGED